MKVIVFKLVVIFSINLILQNNVIAQQNDIQWNYNGKIRVKGTGCDMDALDTFAITTGNQVTIIFTRLGVELNSDSAPMEENSTCKVVIPIKVAQKKYISSLRQSILYGWIKTKGSKGTLKVTTKVFKKKATPIHVKLKKKEEGMVPYDEIVTEDYFYINQDDGDDDINYGDDTCKDTSSKGKLVTKINIHGKRTKPEQQLIIQIDGADIIFDLNGRIGSCD